MVINNSFANDGVCIKRSVSERKEFQNYLEEHSPSEIHDNYIHDDTPETSTDNQVERNVERNVTSLAISNE
jgi:hypothetical protein